MCGELGDNPIYSQDCAKCKGVSHHLFSNNMAALYLQRDIPIIDVYCSQSYMMSMDQATPKIVAIESNIEFYYK